VQKGVYQKVNADGDPDTVNQNLKALVLKSLEKCG
jgi:hypothetical protein